MDDIADLVTLEASDWTATSFSFTAAAPLPDAHHITVEALSTDYAASVSGSTLSSPTIDFSELAGKQVMIQWCSEEDDITAQGAVIVPIIVDDNTESDLSQFDQEILRDMDIYVRSDKELKLTASTQVHNILLNSGSSLNIATTDADAGITLRLNSLSMKGGWNAALNRYDIPRIYINPKSTLNKSVNTVNLDLNIYNSSEGKHYYPFAVPFPVTVSSIDYADPTLAAASVYGKHYVIKTYDGAHRAEYGADKDNNWVEVASDATLQPGRGYIITAVAVGGKAELRIPISFTNAWTTLGEQATVDAVTKNISSVTAHTGTAATAHSRHAGWNFLGVPYMSCFGASEAMYDGEGAATLIEGQLVYSPTSYDYDDADIPYVSVPSHDFAEYFQTDITETELRPGWGFFIQAGTTGNLTFLSSARQDDEDAPLYIQRRAEENAPKYKTAVQLTAATGKTDKTTFIFSDRYTPDYEIGADLEKMFGEGYTLALYSMPGTTRLAFNASPLTDETIPLGFRVPEDGTYTFALPDNTDRYDIPRFEHLYLIDYQTGELTDLKKDSYSFTSVRTQDETRFALAPVFRKDSPTGTENVADKDDTDDTKVRKAVLNGILYIVRDGRIYNATGDVINNGK